MFVHFFLIVFVTCVYTMKRKQLNQSGEEYEETIQRRPPRKKSRLNKDIFEYPSHTLSSEYQHKFSTPEKDIKRILSLSEIDGVEYEWLPIFTSVHWFCDEVKKTGSIFALNNIQKMLNEITFKLEDIPITTLYIATVNMVDCFEHCKEKIYLYSSTDDKIMKTAPIINHGKTSIRCVFANIHEHDKRVVLTETSNDPIQRILHKNHKTLDACYITKTENRFVHELPHELSKKFGEMCERMTMNRGGHGSHKKDTAKKSASEVNITNEGEDEYKDIFNRDKSRRKKRSVWNIAAYMVIVGNTINEKDVIVQHIKDQIDSCKSYKAKVHTLIQNAHTFSFPYWISHDVMLLFDL